MSDNPTDEEVKKFKRELLITRVVAIAMIVGCIVGMIAVTFSLLG